MTRRIAIALIPLLFGLFFTTAASAQTAAFLKEDSRIRFARDPVLQGFEVSAAAAGPYSGAGDVHAIEWNARFSARGS